MNAIAISADVEPQSSYHAAGLDTAIGMAWERRVEQLMERVVEGDVPYWMTPKGAGPIETHIFNQANEALKKGGTVRATAETIAANELVLAYGKTPVRRGIDAFLAKKRAKVVPFERSKRGPKRASGAEKNMFVVVG